MASPLILREGEPARRVELSPQIADALATAGVVQLTRTEHPRWWEIAAGTQIGVLRVGGLQLIIEPKISINRLVFLIGYARKPTVWRADLVQLTEEVDLPEALANAFVLLARRALDQGILKGYVTVDETSTVLRGRVREADQLRRRWGRAIPLEVRYDEFTVDIAENQLLLAAANELLRMPGVGVRYRAGLQRLRIQLADVTLPPRGALLPAWLPSRLNARYQPALEIAEFILSGRSFEQRVGDVVVSGYLFNMATIFEDFVTVALSEALKPYGGRPSLQHRTHLDESHQVPIRPDFVWSTDGVPQIVADAKYKAEKPAGFPQADLYQLLAYCTVLKLPVGHLIYAQGNESPNAYDVRNSGVRIVAHTLDLDSSPATLLATVGALAQNMIDATT